MTRVMPEGFPDYVSLTIRSRMLLSGVNPIQVRVSGLIRQKRKNRSMLAPCHRGRDGNQFPRSNHGIHNVQQIH